MTNQRPRHEWYLKQPHCRHCGLIALSPEEQLLADILIPCLWPNSYGINTLPQAIHHAKGARLHAHNEHARLTWEADQAWQQVYEEAITQLTHLLGGSEE